MTEFELNKLKDMPTPKPRARAKAAALKAAVQAFDNTAAKTNDEPPKVTKGSATTQGKPAPTRQTHIASNPRRRKPMRLTQTTYAIAASLLVTAVSVPVLMHYMRKSPLQYTSGKLETFADEEKLRARPSAHNRVAGLGQKPATTAPAPRLAAKPPGEKWRSDDNAASKRPAAKPDKDNAATGQVATRPVASKPVAPPKFALQRLHNELKSNHSGGRAAGGAAIGGDRLARQNQQSYMRGLLASNKSASDGSVARNRLALDTLAKLTNEHDQRGAAPRYVGRDKFERVKDNPIKSVKAEPVSTFSVDVDTASYAFVRRALNAGRLPQKHAVRVEELINYFAYDYATPETRAVPFEPSVTVLPSPWNPQNQLVHIGIKGYALNASERPRANLVFLIDVSGSMQGSDRLPLLKNAFRMLVDNLKPDDTIGIVTYASGSGVALQSTKISQKAKILTAIDRLGAGGSTAGARGIRDAYQLARSNFDKSAVNRIILATDGDFNVGISNREELKSYIERQRKTGVFLSILGVGRGNYNDALMQTLAQNGNGTAAYIDTLNEARKVLVEEASSTLFPIAKDVKIQIEFNPARVKSYRLIGYETRALKREDFNNDKIDAGEVGSGHRVTAIYEIKPVGATNKLVDSLRYGKPASEPAAVVVDPNAEFGFLKLRYKLPKESKSRLISLPITRSLTRATPDAASADVRFSTAVAAFGQLLRGGASLGSYGFDDVIALANGAKGADPFGTRAEFVNLVRLAKTARP